MMYGASDQLIEGKIFLASPSNYLISLRSLKSPKWDGSKQLPCLDVISGIKRNAITMLMVTREFKSAISGKYIVLNFSHYSLVI